MQITNTSTEKWNSSKPRLKTHSHRKHFSNVQYVKCILLENRYLSVLINNRYKDIRRIKFTLKIEFSLQSQQSWWPEWDYTPTHPTPILSIQFHGDEILQCGEDKKEGIGRSAECRRTNVMKTNEHKKAVRGPRLYVCEEGGRESRCNKQWANALIIKGSQRVK